MPSYHCSVKPVQRSAGRSSTAAAAYRAGCRIDDERTGDTHDYTRKGGVLHSELVGWSGSRAELWNAAEKAERRKDATTAREYEIALPRELSTEQQIELAREYVTYLHDRHGCAADWSLHRPDPEHGNDNPHAHILTTTRTVDQDGHALGEKCAREWSDRKRQAEGLPGRKEDLTEAREQWASMQNRHLEQAGISERVDHRSNQERGLTPRPHVHLGPKATAMERRGEVSDRGEENRRIDYANRQIQQQQDQLRQSQDQLARLMQQHQQEKEAAAGPQGYARLKQELARMEQQQQLRGVLEKKLRTPPPNRGDLVKQNLDSATRSEANEIFSRERGARERQGFYEQAEAEYKGLSWRQRTFSGSARRRLRTAADQADAADQAVARAKDELEAARLSARPEAEQKADQTLAQDQKDRQKAKSELSELATPQDVEKKRQEIQQHPCHEQEKQRKQQQDQEREAREAFKRMADERQRQEEAERRRRDRDHEMDGPSM